ncbi:SAM-dependent methyltransferase [Nocardia asteroides]|uniref:SAM-dependent methyltransferase n=1 Tax=Nocardia asteroides TaxID=1824 RepID=UPI001E4AAD8D|nr:SAM-dependent methyltransferase [Nocardia asteroides]UGT62697.1 SAM-dependent methyltransferase [Nocardia asteroides]
MGEASSVPVAGVAMTAIGVAVIRAKESERPDRLYDDPFAAAFVAAARPGFDAERWQQFRTLAERFQEGRSVAVRLADDRVREAVDSGIRQLVLLGAGLDTRAFRLELPPDTTVFEIDLPETFAFKEPVLGDAVPRCGRAVIAADLRENWAEPLRAHGFRPDRPTGWIDEGTLGYLPADDTRSIVGTLTELSAPGSRFAVNRVASDTASTDRYRELHELVAAGDPDRGAGPESEIEFLLRDLGWDTEFQSWNEAVTALGRTAALAGPEVGTIAAVRSARPGARIVG